MKIYFSEERTVAILCAQLTRDLLAIAVFLVLYSKDSKSASLLRCSLKASVYCARLEMDWRTLLYVSTSLTGARYLSPSRTNHDKLTFKISILMLYVNLIGYSFGIVLLGFAARCCV